MPSTDPLILGIYAWTLTVAIPCFDVATATLPRVACILGLFSLVAGWSLMAPAPRLADYFGTVGFCGFSLCALIPLGPLSLGFGSPIVRMTMGAIVWCLFAVSWTRARQVSLASSSAVVPTAIPDASASGHIKPLRSKLVIGSAGVLCAAGLSLYGIPRSNGRGVLIVGLIVLATLKLTSAASTLLARVSLASIERRPTSNGQPKD
jgi:hypothetical protein